MGKWKIYFVGLASAFADVSTTWIGMHYYNLAEMNPLANPFLEAATVLGGQALILHLGEKLKVNPKVRNAIALGPAMVPFAVAANNIRSVAMAHAKYYPWEECPLLYPK